MTTFLSTAILLRSMRLRARTSRLCKYIEFVNRDENVDYDTKMEELQAELTDLLKQEEQSKKDLLAVFKELGYEIKL